MRSFLLVYLTALASLVYGLWFHDWVTILSGCLLALMWPFVVEEVAAVARKRELDELWDDNDLAGSA